MLEAMVTLRELGQQIRKNQRTINLTPRSIQLNRIPNLKGLVTIDVIVTTLNVAGLFYPISCAYSRRGSRTTIIVQERKARIFFQLEQANASAVAPNRTFYFTIIDDKDFSEC